MEMIQAEDMPHQSFARDSQVLISNDENKQSMDLTYWGRMILFTRQPATSGQRTRSWILSDDGIES